MLKLTSLSILAATVMLAVTAGNAATLASEPQSTSAAAVQAQTQAQVTAERQVYQHLTPAQQADEVLADSQLLWRGYHLYVEHHLRAPKSIQEILSADARTDIVWVPFVSYALGMTSTSIDITSAQVCSIIEQSPRSHHLEHVSCVADPVQPRLYTVRRGL